MSDKGTEANPLTLDDLPFVVPTTGMYWLSYRLDYPPMQLPESPEGSVLALDVERRNIASLDLSDLPEKTE